LTLGDMSLIRGTSLFGFDDLVRELGGDPVALARAAHLPPDAIGDHDSFVSYRGVVAVLEAAAATTGTPDFGRRLGTRQGIDILGPLGVAARTAANVGAALGAIEEYMAVYSPAIAISVRAAPTEPLAVFDWRITVDRAPAHRQAAELALGVSLRVFRLLAGADFRPTSVQLRHEPLTGPPSYEDYFGCPVQFSQSTYGFRFKPAVLLRSLSNDSEVHAVVQEYLASVIGSSDAGTVEVVRQLIRRTLPTGGPDLTVVADQLALHPRTLQRELAAHGTSFAELIDEVRRHEAERYLRETSMPLSQLAGVLGYSEQSALSRACRRWFGEPPVAVRRGART
jgi:AraC-like DNA-binding protein